MRSKDVYNISKSKIEGKTANEIAVELFKLPQRNTPVRALAYLYILSDEFGYSSEVSIKAISDYLQIERGINETNRSNKVYRPTKKLYLENQSVIDLYAKQLNKFRKFEAMPDSENKKELIKKEMEFLHLKLNKASDNKAFHIYYKFNQILERM